MKHTNEVGSVFKREIDLSRIIKMYLCQKYTGEKLFDIGKPFGIGASGVSKACRGVSEKKLNPARFKT